MTNKSIWRSIMDRWMNRNGYDIDKTPSMWAILAFVQHLEWLEINRHIEIVHDTEEE